MTIEVYSFPTSLYPDAQSLVPDIPNQSLQESSFSGAQSVVTPQGAERWRLRMQFDDLTGDRRAQMAAFIVRLRVSRNVFLCINHTAQNRGAYTAPGGIQVTSAVVGRGIIALVASGGASVSSWAREGDFISVNSTLRMVTSDAGANGSGVVILNVWPPNRATINSGTPLYVSVASAFGAFRMVSAVPFNTNPPGYRTSISIDAVEMVNSAGVVELTQ